MVKRLAVILAAVIGLLVVARFARGWARGIFGRVRSLPKLLQGFLAVVVYWLVIAFGLMIVLAALEVNITPLFALVGGASFILAFAMQDTLGNLAAGLMIMINRPFDEGDYVTVAGVGGTVKTVSVVSTTVTTPDNQVIVIPNSNVWGDVITNVTASETRRVDLTFGIGYDDYIEEAQRTLEEVVADHPRVLREPPPVVRVNALNDSSVCSPSGLAARRGRRPGCRDRSSKDPSAYDITTSAYLGDRLGHHRSDERIPVLPELVTVWPV